MRQFTLVFISLVFFLSVVNFTSAQMLESEKQGERAKEQRGQTIEERVNELNANLNLTEEQREKVTGILTKAKEETSKIVEEVSVKIRVIKSNAETEIEGALTKEQLAKFKGIPQIEEEEDTILKVFDGAK
jgi:F0F1-type ATP synthase membrane subunit b/b'